VHHALWNRRPRGAAYGPSCRRRRESNNRLVRANKTSEPVTAINPMLTHNSCGGTWGADVRLVLEAGIVLRQILLVVAGVIACKRDRRGYRDFGTHGVVAMHAGDDAEECDHCPSLPG